MSEPMVRVEGLRKDFNGFWALKGLDFELHPGEVCGFIGPNGAGKTTAMRIMATIELPSAGEVWVNGHSVLQHPDKVRHALGFMPDQYGHYENLTCEEYLDFYARAYRYKGGDRRQRIEAVIEFTGLGPIRTKLMTDLSKGMKQRLCLGRTLIHDPQVMLFDEPAAGLDPRARAELRDLILELSARGKTVFVSSHILTELADICTHVAIIEKGEMKFKGPVGHAQKAANRFTRYRLRVLEAVDKVERFLLEQPFVEKVATNAHELLIDFAADERHFSQLLAALIREGFAVVESRLVQSNLEEAFLAMTKGDTE
ncbi:MAG: Daunorubicin/doxorubicin resistance ATP-binding protein DrrA [Verrucomicrobiae bacterium]|nr:Daunorubicin/doxorubicin resistance ATP-binding protein DrrA [Verrucomicrobiae bacterium]